MSTGTIVIADGDADAASAIRTFLETSTGFRVVAFHTAADALAALVEEKPAVIMAAMSLPDMDGATFLDRARETCPLASRFVLTDAAGRAQAIRAIHEQGLYDLLQSPWQGDQLIIALRNGVERHALLADLDARTAALQESNQALYALRQRLVHAFL
jgi:DNA-binding NtrC family response regulator